MYPDTLYIVYIVAAVLVGLVTLPALVLTIILNFHTPRSSDENSLRWVTYVKLAFRLFTLSNIMAMVALGMSADTFVMPYEAYSRRYLVGWTIQSLSIFFTHVGAASVFISLFYLARVLARPPSDETSRGLRDAQKWALGALVWVCLASITSMGLYISVWAAWAVSDRYSGDSSDPSYAARSLASFAFNVALYATDLICAIGVLVYIVKARKKLLGTPLQKASDILLACGILWLFRVVWLVLSIILNSMAIYPWSGAWVRCLFIILDVLLDIYPTFVVLILLYVLVTTDKYAVWQPREQEQEQEQPTKNMEQVV